MYRLSLTKLGVALVSLALAASCAVSYGAGWHQARSSDECFEGFVQVVQHYEAQAASRLVIGDTVFCGRLGGIRGPSELYHRPHGGG